MLFGIVGAGGYWGPNWVRVLRQLNVLGAVCEKNPDRLKQVAEKSDLQNSKIELLTSDEAMFEMELDGVFIVTPPATHADMAVRAMERGKHVFIEKPMAGNQEQCYKIKFESKRLNRLVMVGHTFVYHPAVRKFKELLPSIGQLRTVYTVRANFGLYQDIGVVHDLLPHDLSIFTYLCQGFPDSLQADVNAFQDVAYVSARYGSVMCSAFLSWSYPEKTRKLTAVGSRGIIEWDLSWWHLLLHRKWAEPVEGESCYRHFDEGTQTILIEDHSEPLMNEALHFMECIRENKQPLTGIEEGINVVKGLEACQ